MLPGKQF